MNTTVNGDLSANPLFREIGVASAATGLEFQDNPSKCSVTAIRKVVAVRRNLGLAGNLAHVRRLNNLQHLLGAHRTDGVVLQSIAPECPLAAGACAPLFYQRMVAQGYVTRTPPQVWEAALPLYAPPTPIDELVENAAEAFEQYMGGRPTGITRGSPDCPPPGSPAYQKS